MKTIIDYKRRSFLLQRGRGDIYANTFNWTIGGFNVAVENSNFNGFSYLEWKKGENGTAGKM